MAVGVGWILGGCISRGGAKGLGVGVQQGILICVFFIWQLTGKELCRAEREMCWRM